MRSQLVMQFMPFFWAHTKYFNVSRQKIPYFNVLRQKVPYFNILWQKIPYLNVSLSPFPPIFSLFLHFLGTPCPRANNLCYPVVGLNIKFEKWWSNMHGCMWLAYPEGFYFIEYSVILHWTTMFSQKKSLCDMHNPGVQVWKVWEVAPTVFCDHWYIY